MANILAICEVGDGALKKTSYEMVSTAKALGGDVSAVLIGKGATGLAPELAKYGAETIYAKDMDTFIPEGYAKAIADLVKDKGISILIFPQTPMGRDMSVRIAALTDSGVVTEATALSLEGDQLVLKKPVHSGKAVATLKITTPIQIVTVRQNSQEIVENAAAGNIESIEVDDSLGKAKLVKFEEKKSTRVALTEADVIVTAGRGIKAAENMNIIEALADVTGAAIGATRATVDAGWLDNSLQVGQTGETVGPNLYFAVGVSGAIQHLAGMSSSKYIVAINKDEDAPIFKASTYGIIDDLFKILPPLTEELKKIQG